jgi:hypothetical protein
MAERIIETKLASFPIQKGEGVPTHLSPSGTIYFDKIGRLCYQNVDGINDWVIFSSSESSNVTNVITSSAETLTISGINTYYGVNYNGNVDLTVPDATGFDGFLLESNGVTNEISFKINKSGTTTYSSVTSDWSSDEYDVNDIDWTKTHLMFVDYQWLGVGRLRFGLNISGQTIYFGESNHVNNSDTVYMSNPSQPIRYEIKQFGAGSGYFDMICSQISSEGALNELYFTTALIHSTTTTMSTSGQKYPYIGYRLKPDIKGIVSQIDKVSILNTSNDNYFITVEFNPTLSTSVTWIDLPDSPFQYALANGTLTITANGFIIESILGEAGASALTSLEIKNTQIRPNTNIDGTKDEMWVCLTPLGNNATFNGTANILYYL